MRRRSARVNHDGTQRAAVVPRRDGQHPECQVPLVRLALANRRRSLPSTSSQALSREALCWPVTFLRTRVEAAMR